MAGAWTEIDPFGDTDVITPTTGTTGRWTEFPAFGTDDRDPVSRTGGMWTEFRFRRGRRGLGLVR